MRSVCRDGGERKRKALALEQSEGGGFGVPQGAVCGDETAANVGDAGVQGGHSLAVDLRTVNVVGLAASDVHLFQNLTHFSPDLVTMGRPGVRSRLRQFAQHGWADDSFLSIPQQCPSRGTGSPHNGVPVSF